MLDTFSLAAIGLVFFVTFIVTFIATPIIGKVMGRRGITGKDVHKFSKPNVPEMCGLGILLGLVVGAAAFVGILPNATRETTAFAGTILIAGAIGFVDDLRPLGAKMKPLLTALAALPILILGTYDPFPVVPLLGPVRLTVVYPVLIPVAMAVTSNAVNMMDVMNGSMAGTVVVVSATVTAILLASGELETAALAAGLVAALLAFYYFNRFPAKVFSGDTGSLAVGAAIAALAILGRIEIVMIVAMIPHIMNAFYGLASVGGLYERREISQRPTSLLGDGTLEASVEKGAPVTLARLILASGSLGEREIVRGMLFLTAVSSLLAILTYLATLAGKT